MRGGAVLTGALMVCAAAGCAFPNPDALSNALSYRPSQNMQPDKRGTVTFYNDTFGDATPDGIVAGPGNDAWFTDPGNDVIGRITAKGTYTLQQPAGAAVSDGITVGPDNNVWFTLGGGGVGTLAKDGTVKIFKDSSGSGPHGITTGPDGALWFAQSGGVGRVTTQGKFKHFSVADPNAQLQGIVTGPDGNLWVTQKVKGSSFSDQVIRVTPKGQYQSYTVGLGPAWICVGPDKALWFTELAANAIGRLTTGGKYTEYPTNYQGGAPSGIATGSDRALWFTDFNGRFGIGRVTKAGKMHFYGSGTVGGDELRQISLGPIGAMWFTSYQGVGGIGRVTTY
jgi:virginiamycin B lyase